jgi:hypothetical protein
MTADPASLPAAATEITLFSADDLVRQIDAFGALLVDCVGAGASIHFIQPFTRDEAAAFWRQKVLPVVEAREALLLVARQAGRLVGTVQLGCDTPPNQRHRAEVRKLLVHPDCRRQGIARLLMIELERLARAQHRSLLTLDTRTGDAAEPLYTALGYQTAGTIPQFCRDTFTDRLDPSTIMYKLLP